MFLNAFKEALKPCKSSSSSEGSHVCASRVSSISPRKPPKSSIFRQILRLRDDELCPPLQTKRGTDLNSGTEDDGGKRDEKKYGAVEDLDLDSSHRHDIACEPLLLSPSGEVPVVEIPASVNSRLLEHQREGVKFLYNLYRNNHGGILGDDMGLGKTIQTIAFLAAVYGRSSSDSHIGKKQRLDKGPALIICPSSVIVNWEAEFSGWSSFKVSVYHGPNRDLNLDRMKNHALDVLITSFDTYRMQGSLLSDIPWEVVVIDEAHKLKNDKSKLYIECSKIKTPKRYGLTGTIMQNKIMELYNLFDFVVPGSLGARDHFREFYDEPLKFGQRSTAPQQSVEVAEERKRHLASVLAKYMLRRTKDETIGHLMMGKEDNVVFCAMSDMQKRVYERALQLPEIECLVNKDRPCSCGSPLKQAECCRRTVPNGVIWSHLHRDSPEGCDSCPFCIVLPCLVKLQQISNHLELINPNPKDDPDKQRRDKEFASAVGRGGCDSAAQDDSFMALSDAEHCGKMRTLERLLRSWISNGDKTLLFSYSARMLDILEKFVIRKGYSFLRLDGSTPAALRQRLVDDFNRSPSKQVFLISTRAGGLGLNLTAANRVVIFDPNWNPAHDLQAQDRSFRYGQTRRVTVFRLLAAGSVEELVYNRQVYKQQLSNVAVAGKVERRYFQGVQDCKEFQGELFGICNLFRDLSDKLFTSRIVETTGKRKAGGVDPDLGIVYAHRNEDIVNLRSEPGETSSKQEVEEVPPTPPPDVKLMSVLMGMDEVELNKLIVKDDDGVDHTNWNNE